LYGGSIPSGASTHISGMMIPSNSAQEATWAVITPSYDLDFERCKLLCRSMDQFLSGPWQHYIIVDPVDVPLFQPLSGPRRHVINKKDILPRGFIYGGKIPFMRLGRFWLSPRHGAVLGWQMQQLVKLLMANFIDEDALAFFDSDLLLLRPFDLRSLSRGKAIRLCLKEDPKTSQNLDIAASIKILGLNLSDLTKFWGDDQIVTWHRETVLALQNFIAAKYHQPWHQAAGWKIHISEYHLYSLFVTDVQRQNPNHFIDNTIYCKGLWSKEDAAKTDILAFCKDLHPPQFVVCVQSLIGADMNILNAAFEAAKVGA
jgi:Family of unknown function (DUF6492)